MLIQTKQLSKKFNNEYIFKNLNIEINENKFVTIFGSSGCGKSTLLNIIGLLDNKYEGTISICNERNPNINSKKGRNLLRNKIGYIFQNFALIDDKSVYDNLMLVLEFSKINKKEKKKRIDSCLAELGLTGYGKKKVYQLSGGQQQRVAIARIMLKQCQIILADEPTGSLDEDNRDEIIEILLKLKSSGATIVVVSHDSAFKEISDKIYEL